MSKQLQVTLNDQEYAFYKNGLVQCVLEKKLNLSKHEISRLKFRGEILLNGRKVHTDAYMGVGDMLTVIFPEDEKQPVTSNNGNVDILYEEDDFVIVNKPSGIPTHASHGHLEDSAGTALQAYYQQRGENFVVRPIGRLDMDVSGIVIFAKNQPSAARLTAMRSTDELHKTYLAFAEGIFSEPEGTVNEPLVKIEGQRARSTAENGKPAVTHYAVKDTFSINGSSFSLVEIFIETGRTHQIRSHMSSIGHPLLGDSLYNGSTEYMKRPALHCAHVAMKSPFTKEDVSVDAPLPRDMQSILDMAEKTNSDSNEQTSTDLGLLVDEIKSAANAPTFTETGMVRSVEKAYEAVKDETFEPAVVRTKQKHTGMKISLLLLVLILLGVALYMYVLPNLDLFGNSEQEKQELYDALNVTFIENRSIEYGMDFSVEDYIENVTGEITEVSEIDIKNVGSQQLRVTVEATTEDGETVTREFTRMVEVVDTTAPVIILKATSVTKPQSYDPAENVKSVKDNVEGDLKYSSEETQNAYWITMDSSESANIVTVHAVDAHGNSAEKTFIWNIEEEENTVEATAVPTATPTAVPTATPTPTPTPIPVPSDTTAPVIVLKSDTVNIYTGEDYALYYNISSVSDDVDGSLDWTDSLTASSWTIQGNVNNTTAGNYTITVIAVDAAGNRSEASYTITVSDPPAAASTVPDSSDAYSQIYAFLTGTMGLNKAQACGILANMHRESRFNPISENSLGYYGLCQWGGGRKERLISWCESNGYDYTTIDGQLHFLQYEFPTYYPNTYAQVTACDNTEEGAREAARIFGIGYEVAGEFNASLSLDKAAEYFNR